MATIMALELPAKGASEASDEAYQLVAEGYLRAVSVGFRPLEWEPMPDGRGTRFTSVELLEISLVSVPANASALLAARLGGKGGHGDDKRLDRRLSTNARHWTPVAQKNRFRQESCLRPGTSSPIIRLVSFQLNLLGDWP